MNQKNRVLWIVLFAALVAGLATFVASFFVPAPQNGGKRPEQQTIGSVSGDELIGEDVLDFPDEGLVDQASRPASFETLPDKPTLISFIYTRCPMPKMCPLITHKVRTVQKTLQAEGQRPAHYVLVSFDPAYDTPEVLKEYGNAYGLDYASAEFWTGAPETIHALGERLRIAAPVFQAVRTERT